MGRRSNKPRGGDSKNPTTSSTSKTDAEDPPNLERVPIRCDHLTNTRGLWDVRAPMTPPQAHKVMAKLWEQWHKEQKEHKEQK